MSQGMTPRSSRPILDLAVTPPAGPRRRSLLRMAMRHSSLATLGALLAFGTGSGTAGARARGQVPAASSPSPGVRSAGAASRIPAVQSRPNVVLIVLDDAGFAATSMFGGLASTPAFERLAADGVRYNRFNVTSICAPTRAALLSGRNPHQVGFGQIPETAATAPGYNAQWPRSAASLAEHLKRMGYGTAAIGKWHNTPAADWGPLGPFDRWPTGLGFEHFYGTLGTTSMWEPLLWRGTTAVPPPKTAEQGYNLTEDLVDDAVAWIHTRESLAPDQPYFLYFATTAVHSPHQVPDRWITPYRGKFAAGWESLRAEILVRQKAMGIVPGDAVLAPRDKALPAWDTLSPAEKTVAERQMEILAGYMSQTDHEVGRLIDTVRKGPNGQNTMIILIAGDNGSSGEDGPLGCDDCPQLPRPAGERVAGIRETAGPDHIAGSAAGWASMNNTPFPGMKRQASYLGGIRTPMVISWPGHTARNGAVRSQWIDVTDVPATLYDLFGYKPPAMIDGVRQLPIEGTSFAASLTTPDAPTTHHVQYFETYGTRSIYRDGWMASLRFYDKPWGEPRHGGDNDSMRWELYDLDRDFSQSRDVSLQYPRRLKQMIALFDSEARRNNVYPLGEIHLWFDLPDATYHRRDITLYPDAPILSWDKNPDFHRAYRITADLNLADDRADGLILSSGMRGRGFALYMKNGSVVFEGAHGEIAGDPSTMVVTGSPLKQGAHVVVVEVSASSDYGGAKDRAVRIMVDGRPAASGSVPEGVEPFYGSATLNIGVQHNSPVTGTPQPPFSGKVERVRILFP